ncbi:mannosyltransferase putative-domain-containing protein [Scheffersomyces amazonensis]|uniref:mannosyltransferase putative-domain-containing protein n=1 Tax=Scheffersomyces amazonensis TaxID=1078765 RepID=UPI00315D9099
MKINQSSIKRAFNPSRHRRLTYLVLTVFLLVVCYIQILPGVNRESSIRDFNIIRNRKSFVHPVYERWSQQQDSIHDLDFNTKCEKYFQDLSSFHHGEFTTFQSHDLDIISNIYKKKKFIRELEKQWKKELSAKGERFNKEVHSVEIEKVYNDRSYALSGEEAKIVEAFSHMRIWGKCFVESDIINSNYKWAAEYESKLYPWLSGSLPMYENLKGQKLPPNELPIYDDQKKFKNPTSGIIRNLVDKSNGKGIVIPVLPEDFSNVGRLIRVLRVLKNDLPIQLLSLGPIPDLQKQKFIDEAQTSRTYIPDSGLEYFKKLFNMEIQFPPQDLWFVDMSPAINYEKHPILSEDDSSIHEQSTLIHTLSTIFHSFEEAVILLPSAIPTVEISKFFDLSAYKDSGHFFFKLISSYEDNRVNKFNPGFHEITELVENYLTPSKLDTEFFGIPKREPNADMTRIYRHNFRKLIDPTVMVLNKKKSLNGLLSGHNFLLHNLFSLRFPLGKDQMNFEHFWIGQELAGHVPTFNIEYAVGVGVLTPSKNRPLNIVTTAQEICSSSWGQIDIFTEELMYVTAFQLDNIDKSFDKFMGVLEKKYVEVDRQIVYNDDGTNKTIETIDRKFFNTKVKPNPFLIESVMRVPTILQPVYSQDIAFREPNFGWISQDNGGSNFPYWCSYDVIGHSYNGLRGIVNNISTDTSMKYKYLFDIWRQPL